MPTHWHSTSSCQDPDIHHLAYGEQNASTLRPQLELQVLIYKPANLTLQ